MKTKQTIAVIGASGNMGSSISKSLSKGHYRLLLCSEDNGQVQAVANDIKITNPTAEVETPFIDGKQVDAFIAGNDEEALQTVADLVTTAGFNPIVAGDLSVSRTLENMQLLLIQLGMKYNYNWLAGWKILHN